jgi:hypothetical protein
LHSGPSATIPDGSRVYASGGGPALNVYQSVSAGKSPATLATWSVDDIDQVVDELTAVDVEFVRYDEFEHDAKGITPRGGGGRIAWFQDPDGNTSAIEADAERRTHSLRGGTSGARCVIPPPGRPGL